MGSKHYEVRIVLVSKFLQLPGNRIETVPFVDKQRSVSDAPGFHKRLSFCKDTFAVVQKRFGNCRGIISQIRHIDMRIFNDVDQYQIRPLPLRHPYGFVKRAHGYGTAIYRNHDLRVHASLPFFLESLRA